MSASSQSSPRTTADATPSKAKGPTKTPPTSSSKGSEDSLGHVGTFHRSTFEKMCFQETIDAEAGTSDQWDDNMPDRDQKDGNKMHGSSLAVAAPSDSGCAPPRSGKRKAKGEDDAPNRVGEGNIDPDTVAGARFPSGQCTLLWFNRACYIICFAFFLYLASEVVKDYRRQWDDGAPLTGTSVDNEPLQLFPGIIICNIANVSITSLVSKHGPQWASSTEQDDITRHWKPLECGYGCYQLDAPLRAFNADPATGKCMDKNVITVMFNVNSDLYPSTQIVTGIEGIVYRHGGETNRIAEFWCSDEIGSCGTAAFSGESCPSNLGDLSYDVFRAPSGMASTIKLKRSETQQGGPHCDQSVQSWSPTIFPLSLNKRFLEGMNLTDPGTMVSIWFEFKDPFVAKETYQPMSAATMFGSVAGWFGFLSDGWGIITLLFMIEKAVMYGKQATTRSEIYRRRFS